MSTGEAQGEEQEGREMAQGENTECSDAPDLNAAHEVQHLKRSRGVYQGQVTGYTTKLHDFINKGDLQKVILLLGKLETAHSKMLDAHQNYVSHLSKEEREADELNWMLPKMIQFEDIHDLATGWLDVMREEISDPEPMWSPEASRTQAVGQARLTRETKKTIKREEPDFKAEPEEDTHEEGTGDRTNPQPVHQPERKLELNPDAPPFPGRRTDLGTRDRPTSTPVGEQHTALLAMAQTQERMAQLLLLPPTDVPKFEGDYTKYREFIELFETRIASRAPSSREKLNYLLQLTEDKAKSIVRGCIHLEPDEGYARARQLLEEKYGSTFEIGEAYLKKALTWKPMRADQTDEVERYAIYLRECSNAMLGLGKLSELEHHSSMKEMVRRLPIHLQRKWIAMDTDSLETSGHPATFERLVCFIEKQAHILNNPRYKPEAPRKPDRQQDSRQTQPRDTRPPKRASFATSVQDSTDKTPPSSGGGKDAACAFCDYKGHSVASCWKFQAKSHQEKMDWLKANRHCFSCVKRGHRSADCYKKATCQKCQGRHPTVLHKDKPDTKKAQESGDPSDSGDKGNAQSDKDNKPPDTGVKDKSGSEDKKSTCGRIGAGLQRIGMAIIPVRIRSKETGRELITMAFLDSVSGASFCTEDISEKLGLKGEQSRLNLVTMTSNGQPTELKRVRNLEIADLEDQTRIKVDSLYVHKNIPVSEDEIVTKEDIFKWDHLRHIPLRDITTDIGLLLGNDVPEAIQPLAVVTGEGREPFAVRTQLGWTVSGPLGDSKKPGRLSVNAISVTLQEQLHQYVNMDFTERANAEDTALSQEEEKFMKYVQENMRHNGERYEVGIPVRADVTTELPNNREQALSRLQGVTRRMERNEDFAKDYEKCMSDMIEKGYIEEVDEDQGVSGKIWYLPHHCVYNKHKPGKARVVFDGSATYKGECLNNRLLKGPDLTNRLDGVLLRFRQGKIGITSDIRKMFYQICVAEEDRDLYRLLWYKDGAIKDFRFTVHVFGSSSSPGISNYALVKNAEDNEKDFSPEVIRAAKDSSYVDDSINAEDTARDAVDVSTGLIELRARGGFELVQWNCSDPRVLEQLPESAEVSTVSIAPKPPGTECTPALGMNWNYRKDQISYRVPDIDKPNTKRGALAVVCSIFDPLGLISPIVLQGKQLIQEMGRRKLEWDAPLPSDLLSKWRNYKHQLREVSSWVADRCTNKDIGKVESRQLHVFSDACESGYGVAAYLREEDEEGQVVSNLIYARSRVAPVKQQSIPRLELTAATTAARVMRHLTNELRGEVKLRKLWTDSQIVLGYLNNNTKNYKVFVANRIATIRRLTEVEQWAHVPGQHNPADIASRGATMQKLQSDLWRHGPVFLQQSEEFWPSQEEVTSFADTDVEDPEVKTARTGVESLNVTLEVLERRSEWKSVVGFAVTMARVPTRSTEGPANNTRSRTAIENKSMAEQEQAAKMAIFRTLQQAYYGTEIERLKNGQPLQKESSLRNLDVFIAPDGLIRIQGRLRRSTLPEGTKCPIVLPGQSPIIKSLIRETHQKLAHVGRNQVIAELQKEYWIVRLMWAVKRILVLHKCTVCRRYRGRTIEQRMADLPPDRVETDNPPFTKCGMDYFGPVYIKMKRHREKRYGVIFSCATSRAIHLEIAHSLTTDSCIMAIRRFAARRGHVKKIISDNGTNLTGADAEIRESVKLLNADKLEKDLTKLGIEWQFNTPTSSHQGGMFERMIRSVRKCLFGVLKGQVVDEESLQTAFAEAEFLVNSRPLTHIKSTPDDLQALSPNMLLTSKDCDNVILKIEGENYAVRRWKQIAHISRTFWERYKSEYLTMLHNRTKWRGEKPNLKCGDVVLLKDVNTGPAEWPMGVVIRTFPGEDSRVRNVEVRTSRGVYQRPVQKLILFVEGEEEY